jgi:hypothetical protein
MLMCEVLFTCAYASFIVCVLFADTRVLMIYTCMCMRVCTCARVMCLHYMSHVPSLYACVYMRTCYVSSLYVSCAFIICVCAHAHMHAHVFEYMCVNAHVCVSLTDKPILINSPPDAFE